VEVRFILKNKNYLGESLPENRGYKKPTRTLSKKKLTRKKISSSLLFSNEFVDVKVSPFKGAEDERS